MEARMSGTQHETEEQIDETIEETFPASDPPAQGGTTGPRDLPPEGRAES
jgi:hypothetical protein